MTLSIQDISSKVQTLRSRYANRDSAMQEIRMVRQGEIQHLYPGMFSDEWPRSVVANFIDVAARDVAEVLAPLPAFNCSATNASSDRAREFADKRTKGAAFYIEQSRLQTAMYTGADQYHSYGFLPIFVEPDFETKQPRITLLDPFSTYPEFDRFGRTVSLTMVMRKPIVDLVAEYPELALVIAGPYSPSSNSLLEVVRYIDKDQHVMFLPDRNDAVLARAENYLDRCPVRVVVRPGLNADNPRGQFDDIVWIQIARHRFAIMGLEAAQKSVQAPLSLPQDVQEFPYGPDSVLYSADPDKIRRVGVEFPQAAVVEGQLLESEQLKGARYPQARSGNVDASIITGQGVEKLMEGFSSQIKAAQDVFAEGFRDVLGMCFELDEKLWPDLKRRIRGNENGVPYEIEWKPSRDIHGDYSIDVTYGFAAGLDPNRALVLLLQLLGGQLVSKDLVRRQFPFGVNVTEQEQLIDIENLRDSLIASVAGYAQAIPVLAQNGMDPGAVLNRLSMIIDGRKKGKTLEDVVSKAFAPPEQVSPGPSSAGSGGTPSGEGAPGETSGPGGNPDLVPQAPQQQQDLLSLLAGLGTSGNPQSSAQVQRRMPA